MPSFSDVSAVIVTRGNTDLSAVLDSLAHFHQVLVWNNAIQKEDSKTYGRTLALPYVYGYTKLVYSQDDDIIHTRENQQAILDAYQPGILTGCMWPEWSDGAKAQGIPNGYDDLVFMGSGSVFDRDVPQRAADRYLAHYPADDFFHLWADTIIGILAPTQQLDIRFEALPIAEAPDRMCNLPNAVEQKTEAIRRAREIRDDGGKLMYWESANSEVKLSGREYRLAHAEARRRFTVERLGVGTWPR